MKEMWRSDSCYSNYGVDGSTCSFFIYLSEVSPVCLWECAFNILIIQLLFVLLSTTVEYTVIAPS